MHNLQYSINLRVLLEWFNNDLENDLNNKCMVASWGVVQKITGASE